MSGMKGKCGNSCVIILQNKYVLFNKWSESVFICTSLDLEQASSYFIPAIRSTLFPFILCFICDVLNVLAYSTWRITIVLYSCNIIAVYLYSVTIESIFVFCYDAADMGITDKILIHNYPAEFSTIS